MSAALQSDPSKEHTPEDDLESFIHVLTWLCLRYMKTSFAPEELPYRLTNLYENGDANAEGQDVETGAKMLFFLVDAMWHFTVKGNKPLTKLIHNLRKLFAPRYGNNSNKKEVKFSQLLEYFNRALDSKGWPDNDAAEDLLPTEHRLQSITQYQLGAMIEASGSEHASEEEKQEEELPPSRKRRAHQIGQYIGPAVVTTGTAEGE
jgi:hypothetical protein